MRQHDYVWADLPTTFDHQTGDVYYYEAKTPGFSYFAVTGKNSLPAPTILPQETVLSYDGAQTVLPVSTTHTITTNPTTASPSPDLTPEKTGTPVPATAVPGPAAGIPAAYWVAALVVLVLAAVGFVIGRRWYQRRQNPTLFRKD